MNCLIGFKMPSVASLSLLSDASAHGWGVAAFVGVYVLLLIWLVLMPARLLNEPAGRPWWKSSRLWAIGIAVVQVFVYLQFG
ncbi:MAG: hypothetical protein GX621_18030 [Pirellulaceae bacterium]|nr:hypothetical protein [Pirellulaceae bacterium]